MPNTRIVHPQLIRILDHYKTIWSLNHFSALGYWDLETYMPQEGIEARSEALAKIASLSQKLFLDKEFMALIKEAIIITNLNDYERAVLRLLLRSLKFYERLPSEFIEALVRTTSEATTVWRKAKQESNFPLFQPYLEKIVSLSRKKADYLGYNDHPYDALLDEYEEGLTTKDVERYFASIKEPLIRLLKRIKSSQHYKEQHELENVEYNKEDMRQFMDKLLLMLHGGFSHLRLDISAHPFSTSLGKGDTRITTRYEGKDFGRSYGSTIHEYGHALYEIQSHEDLHYTPISGGSSLVIHESQSRFWENFVGRSREFLQQMYLELIATNPSLKKYAPEELHRYLNLVKPSLIRTEADEVTYHFHVMIRFEIEKALLEGSLEVAQIPDVWRQKYHDYLGIEPTDDATGVLQDVHWSQGSIGYFPTYSLGTALSAMWKHALERQLGPITALLAQPEGIKQIQAWLKEHIHQFGSTYTFAQLVKKSAGEDFTPVYLLSYLENKYATLYP